MGLGVSVIDQSWSTVDNRRLTPVCNVPQARVIVAAETLADTAQGFSFGACVGGMTAGESFRP